MNAHPLVVSPWTTARDARRAAREYHVDHLLIGSVRALHGLVCLCDLFEAPNETPISNAMTPNPVTIGPRTPAAIAVHRMHAQGLGCLPVVSAHRLLGVLTRGDLARRGIPYEATGLVCACCGSHNHVAADANLPDVGFCHACASRAHEDIDYEDLGCGD